MSWKEVLGGIAALLIGWVGKVVHGWATSSGKKTL